MSDDIKSLKDEFRIHTEQDNDRFQKLDDKLDNQPTKEDFENLSKEIKAHMEKVEPFMQAIAGMGWIAKAGMGVGAAILLWMQIKGFFGFK